MHLHGQPGILKYYTDIKKYTFKIHFKIMVIITGKTTVFEPSPSLEDFAY
jgi:hypothetical protein